MHLMDALLATFSCMSPGILICKVSGMCWVWWHAGCCMSASSAQSSGLQNLFLELNSSSCSAVVSCVWFWACSASFQTSGGTVNCRLVNLGCLVCGFMHQKVAHICPWSSKHHKSTSQDATLVGYAQHTSCSVHSGMKFIWLSIIPYSLQFKA